MCTGSTPTSPLEVNVVAKAAHFKGGLDSGILELILRKILTDADGSGKTTCSAPTDDECKRIDNSWNLARLEEAKTKVSFLIMAGVHTFKAMTRARDLIHDYDSKPLELTADQVKQAKVRTLPLRHVFASLTARVFLCPISAGQRASLLVVTILTCSSMLRR